MSVIKIGYVLLMHIYSIYRCSREYKSKTSLINLTDLKSFKFVNVENVQNLNGNEFDESINEKISFILSLYIKYFYRKFRGSL